MPGVYYSQPKPSNFQQWLAQRILGRQQSSPPVNPPVFDPQTTQQGQIAITQAQQNPLNPTEPRKTDFSFTNPIFIAIAIVIIIIIVVLIIGGRK